MTITVGRAIAGLFFAAATGVVTAYATLYWYALMQTLGLLLVVPVGLVVAGQIFLIVRLENSADPMVSAIGKGFGTAMMYLSLFEGLLFTVLVLWVVSVVFGYDRPPSRAAFAAGFILSAGYLSCFIYGATGLAAMAGASGTGQRIAGGVYALAAIGFPLALLIGWESALTAWGRARPGLLLLVGLAYLVAGSIAGMGVLLGGLRSAGPERPRAGRRP